MQALTLVLATVGLASSSSSATTSGPGFDKWAILSLNGACQGQADAGTRMPYEPICAHTEESCRAACEADPTCKSIDYFKKSRCCAGYTEVCANRGMATHPDQPMSFAIIRPDHDYQAKRTAGQETFPLPEDSNSWQGAYNVCASNAMRLCTVDELCPGPLQTPYGGMWTTDTWMPTLESKNSWLSVGNYDYTFRLCKTHHDPDGLAVRPSWGSSNGDKPSGRPDDRWYRDYVTCCPTSTISLRVSNAGATPWRPAPYEIELYRDAACTDRIDLTKEAFSANSMGSMVSSPDWPLSRTTHMNLFDGISDQTGNYWRPNCHSCAGPSGDKYSYPSSCGEAWVALTFPESVDIRCVKAPHFGDSEGGAGTHYTGGVKVEHLFGQGYYQFMVTGATPDDVIWPADISHLTFTADGVPCALRQAGGSAHCITDDGVEYEYWTNCV